MGAEDMLIGALTGGSYDVLAMAVGQNKSAGQPPAPPPQNDYSAVMAYMSDNNKTVAMAQIMGQEFSLQQATVDRQMQNSANLELGIEKLDTSLQVAKLDFFQQMTGEQNQHVEKIAQIDAVKLQNLEKSRSTPEADLPAPDFLA